jgi:hypothetical protein
MAERPRPSQACVRERSSGREGERGATLVEFAIVSLLLFTLLFGIVEFGFAFNNAQAVRQGVREGARQGSVLSFGANNSCGLTGLSGSPSQDVQRLMCLTKSQIGLGNDTRVKVMFTDANVTTQQSTAFTQGGSIIVCAQTPIRSLTGMFAPFLEGRNLTSKTTIRIEQTSTAPQRDGQEAPPPGADWSWCTVTGAAP